NDAEAEGVEGPDVDLGGSPPEDCLKLSPERGRGGRGEGDGEDAGCRDVTVADEIGDPTGQRGRLAATGSSQDAERPLASGDCGTLLWRKSAKFHKSVRSMLRACPARR